MMKKKAITIMTISTPIPNKNKSGFKSTIGSSITIDNLRSFSKNFIFNRMYHQGLRKFIAIFVSDIKLKS